MVRTRRRRIASLCCALVLLTVCAYANEQQINPCLRADVSGAAEGDYLRLTYQIRLSNPTDEVVQTPLLRRLGILEDVERSEDSLVVYRSEDRGDLAASVPARWRGDVTVRARQRISEVDRSARGCAIPLPPALSRSIELDLTGENLALEALPSVSVEKLRASRRHSRFRILPGPDSSIRCVWREEPPMAGTWTLQEEHSVTIGALDFEDRVRLSFALPDAGTQTMSAGMPDGVTISEVSLDPRGSWRIHQGRLDIRYPGRQCGRVVFQCILQGGLGKADGSARLLHVPLFGSERAQRRRGRVRINAARHELMFAQLRGATQVAPEGARLACDVHGRDALAVVRAVPLEARRHALVQSHYQLTRFDADGIHKLFLSDRKARRGTVTLDLPPGHLAGSVKGPIRDWSQEGTRLRIELDEKGTDETPVVIETEYLSGGKQEVELRPPVAVDATSADYAMGIAHKADLQIRTLGRDESWRVKPEQLPEWLRRRRPAIAYRYSDAAPAVLILAEPTRVDIRGSIQEHARILPERIERDALFLLTVSKRPVETLELALPPDLTLESVEGPAVETWDSGDDPSRVTVRFLRPMEGSLHFRVLTRGPAGPKRLTLRGIRLTEAELKGWIGIDTDIAVQVRPLENGQMNLGSVRTDQAPAYLKVFDNQLLYRCYSSDWEMELTKKPVPTVYTAEALNALRFGATQTSATVLLRITVEQGGLSELELRLPPGASAPSIQVPNALTTRWRENVGRVQLSGRQTGTFLCRVKYAVPGGGAASTVALGPVRLVGARPKESLLLLMQADPEVSVKVPTTPRALRAVDAARDYPEWSWQPSDPVLAAYAYRELDWTLDAQVRAHRINQQMARALIPMAELDTLLRDNEETLNRLRLFIANSNQQFLTVDLAGVDPEARLIGAYVYGEPVKPFRQGGAKLEIPLLSSEKAARAGMAVLDITYSAPQRKPGALMSPASLRLPTLGLGVGQLEWTLRLPRDRRIALVKGNMEKPVSAPPPMAGLGARALEWIGQHATPLILLLALVVLLPLIPLLWRRVMARLPQLDKILKVMPVPKTLLSILVIVGIVLILAGIFMPSLERAKCSSIRSGELGNLHNIGLGIAMYRDAHDGDFPPDMQALLEEGYIEDEGVLKSTWGEDARLFYNAAAPDADPGEAVAFFLHPDQQGANVLFADGAVQWVAATDGRIENPRTSQEIAVPEPMPGYVWGVPLEHLAPAPAFQQMEQGAPVQGFDVSSGEIEEAFQQMAQQAPAAAPTSARPIQEQADRAILEANRERIEQACERYRQEHGGRDAKKAAEITPYIGDKRLRDALRRQKAPALTKARIQARITTGSEDEGARLKAREELARARYNLGLSYMRQGQYEEAEEQFRRATEHDEDYSAARLQLQMAEALQKAIPFDALSVSKGAAGKLAPKRKAMPRGAGTGLPVSKELAEQDAYIAQLESKLSEGRPTKTAKKQLARPQAAPRQAEQRAELQLPASRASLVRQVGGGRSLGALPIRIDFPIPDTVSYRFEKPFLGNVRAKLGFRLFDTGAILLVELVLAVAALVGFSVVRLRSRPAGVSFAGAVLALTLMALAAGPPVLSAAAGATVLTMGLCLLGETVALIYGYALRPARSET
ncbi:MAG: tetratricopeptide repeat protein [Planctomycetes bacterium]|nr:tetratricopeptide repeat protein [Planctomycetota bacterium]